MAEEIAVKGKESIALEDWTTDAKKVDLVKSTICKGATDNELKLFLHICQRTRLDPFARQIYALQRWNSREGKNEMSTQTSIDGFRLIAERSHQYAGQLGPFWCGDDGKWVDVWLKKEAPLAAKVGILRHDFKEPLSGIANYDAYCAKKKDGTIVEMWKKMPANQLAKCAEALGLRKAFPQDLSGLYTIDEMAQAKNESEVIDATPEELKEEPKEPFKPVIHKVEPLKEAVQNNAGEQKAEPVISQPTPAKEVPAERKVEHKPKGKLLDKSQLNFILKKLDGVMPTKIDSLLCLILQRTDATLENVSMDDGFKVITWVADPVHKGRIAELKKEAENG